MTMTMTRRRVSFCDCYKGCRLCAALLSSLLDDDVAIDDDDDDVAIDDDDDDVAIETMTTSPSRTKITTDLVAMLIPLQPEVARAALFTVEG